MKIQHFSKKCYKKDFDNSPIDKTITNGGRKCSLYPFNKKIVILQNALLIGVKMDSSEQRNSDKRFTKAVLNEIRERMKTESVNLFMKSCANKEEWEDDIEPTDLYKL